MSKTPWTADVFSLVVDGLTRTRTVGIVAQEIELSRSLYDSVKKVAVPEGDALARIMGIPCKANTWLPDGWFAVADAEVWYVFRADGKVLGPFGRVPERFSWLIQRADDPAFVPSLKLLIEEQQYSVTDVGMMFGVSRERVRQWVVKYEIEQRGRNRGKGTRVWDDTQNRFRPVRLNEYRRVMPRSPTISRKTGKASIPWDDLRRAEAEMRARRRIEIVAKITTCAAALGRTPSIREMAIAATGRPSVGHLVGSWGRANGKRAGVLAEIRAACGLTARPRGGAGHVS